MDAEPCTIAYTVNGEELGTAFEFNKADLEGEAMFPHILSKNLAYRVNFGQMENNLLHDLKIKTKDEKKEANDCKQQSDKKEADSKEQADKKEDKNPEEDKKSEEDNKPEEDEKPKEDEKPTEDEKPEEAKEEPSAMEVETTPAVETKDGGDINEGDSEKTAEETPKANEDNEGADKSDEQPPKVDGGNEEQDASTTNGEKKSEETEKEEAEKEETSPHSESPKEINRENLPDYTFIGRVARDENVVAGPVRPESRKECEVVLMIGLPGSGKTTWAQKWVAEHPEKKYNVLGATALIERMKVRNFTTSTKR